MTTITVLYNNIGSDPRLQTAHGFSCLIEGKGEPIMFDTGGDGILLLSNMRKLSKRVDKVAKVVVSHMHWDHAGGLFVFLHENPNVEVFLPCSASKNVIKHVEMLGASLRIVDGPTAIADGVLSIGTMGNAQFPPEMKEQSIIVESNEGSIVLTGCAHPGVINIVKTAAELRGPAIGAVLGGFHLQDSSSTEVDAVLESLNEFRVKNVGASHCSGSVPIARIAAVWQDRFLPFGCGDIFSFS